MKYRSSVLSKLFIFILFLIIIFIIFIILFPNLNINKKNKIEYFVNTKCPTGVKNSKNKCCLRDDPRIVPLVDINDKCCSSGILDKDNVCCPTGKLDSNHKCCLSRITSPSGECCESSSHIVKPVIGYVDTCCPSGIKTVRDGKCCPEDSVGLDENGNCKIGLK